MIRLAVAALADAVTVREDLLNVLSAGISTIVVEELPSNVNLSVALMLEVSGADLEVAQGRTVRFAITSLDARDSILDGEGRVAWEESSSRSLNIPMPISVPSIAIERAGAYAVSVDIEGLPRVDIPFAVMAANS